MARRSFLPESFLWIFPLQQAAELIIALALFNKAYGLYALLCAFITPLSFTQVVMALVSLALVFPYAMSIPVIRALPVTGSGPGALASTMASISPSTMSPKDIINKIPIVLLACVLYTFDLVLTIFSGVIFAHDWAEDCEECDAAAAASTAASVSATLSDAVSATATATATATASVVSSAASAATSAVSSAVSSAASATSALVSAATSSALNVATSSVSPDDEMRVRFGLRDATDRDLSLDSASRGQETAATIIIAVFLLLVRIYFALLLLSYGIKLRALLKQLKTNQTQLQTHGHGSRLSVPEANPLRPWAQSRPSIGGGGIMEPNPGAGDTDPIQGTDFGPYSPDRSVPYYLDSLWRSFALKSFDFISGQKTSRDGVY
ncbi:Inositolphosphorylceramide synthase subunit Kei1-domain-containing protein [Yarrowia lipolytica]|uniref:Inositolphosphorylceramide synthase subunit Kei1-domain-containing protein n=1 Tax=Yarrowia lipolytica TaxID=4952 RepID=A0A1D8NJ59_YARLL|nr:hypothetical protein YALI1_E23525g [Yarrowia lipolytica]KAB8281595.1 Inositolphosphorylceramide synthase subunit Kei1-domain-containing protein [Yarrowia lipolytica]KAE8171055.1 Inositolphosphorylceramide synthase subunit Kei1-domain-containing protein [Yarrowia lipolytica]KAJ8057129.1 Inositolphosphorylceramide synthase subunit Kei1-domain-containing protein [Yarrowia lipolytica]QNP99080.1 Hypothetical protein YALI2_E00396g [Yarrowia lipolytica]